MTNAVKNTKAEVGVNYRDKRVETRSNSPAASWIDRKAEMDHI